MPKLKIYEFPEAVLKQKAQPIARVEQDLRKFADDMLETMYDAPGVGLAANQVGDLRRIVVLDVDYPEDLDSESGTPPRRNPRVLINPEIVRQEGSIVFCEGCLSVPEFTAEVKRAEKIQLKHLDLDGVERTLSAEGLLAIAIQHEIDHLNGVLFIDRLGPLKRDLVRKKLVEESQFRSARPPGPKKRTPRI